MNKQQIEGISFANICKVMQGDDRAIGEIMRYYRPYIRKRATKKLYDQYGSVYVGVDKHLQDRLEEQLMLALLKFRLLDD